jgi:hypothetical protein
VRIAGNYTFEASREEVWAALNDPEVLARTIPGCQRLEQVGESEYDSTLKVGLQAVRGVYTGRVKIHDQKPPEGYRISVNGKGSNGFLQGEGQVGLRVDGDNTILDYGGEAQVGGTIASVGQRLLDGAAKTLINQSLKALAAQIAERRNGTDQGVDAPTEAAEPALASAPALAETSQSPPAEVATIAPAVEAEAQPTSERRTIVVPPGEGLSDQAVARGAVEDFFRERPWLPWVVIAFLIGYILGRRGT